MQTKSDDIQQTGKPDKKLNLLQGDGQFNRVNSASVVPTKT